jgi:hypothetical protein
MTIRESFRSHRKYVAVFAIWLGLAAFLAGSSLYFRWVPWLIASILVLFSAGLALWAIFAAIDRLRGTASANDAVTLGGQGIRRGRVFRSAVALWIIMTAFYCFGAFIDDGTIFLIAIASPPMLVFWVAVVMWAIGLAIGRVWRRLYRSALVAALVPMLAIGTLLHGRDLGDVVRFQIERPSYVAEIAAARSGDRHEQIEVAVGPPMVAFLPWGGFLSTFRGVVFDETDEIAKPLSVRLAAWGDREIPAELKSCPGDVLAVGGHFYIAHFFC